MAVVVNLTRGTVLARRAELAETFLERLRGLLGRTGWGETDGLWIEPCAGVHGLGMRFAVDVVVLDGTLTVLGVERLRPWRVGRVHLEAAAALELPAGTAAKTGTVPGDLLALDPARIRNDDAREATGGDEGEQVPPAPPEKDRARG